MTDGLQVEAKPFFTEKDRNRIKGKMEEALNGFKEEREQLRDRVRIARETYEEVVLKEFKKTKGRDALNDFFRYEFEIRYENCVVKNKFCPEAEDNSAYIPQLVIGGRYDEFKFPKYRNERGSYELLCSKYGWERAEICWLTGLSPSGLSRQIDSISLLWPEKFRGVVLEYKREGIKASSIYHEKIFNLIMDFREEDYIGRFLRKPFANKDNPEEKARAMEELRAIWRELKNPPRELDFHEILIF